jgi:hypothetical protein
MKEAEQQKRQDSKNIFPVFMLQIRAFSQYFQHAVC